MRLRQLRKKSNFIILFFPVIYTNLEYKICWVFSLTTGTAKVMVV